MFKFLVYITVFFSTLTIAEPVAWSPKERVGDRTTGIIGAADFNRDGYVDVAYSRGSGGFQWYAGPNYDGSADEHYIGDGSGNSYGGAVADMNADGWPDLVVSDGARSSGPGRLWLFLHPGSAQAAMGLWQRIEIYSLDVWHQNDLKIADMDGDNRLDVVIRTRSDDLRLVVALQNANINSWTTRAWPTGETSNGPEGLGLGDVDNDGENEIVLSGVYWDNPGGWRSGSPQEYQFDANFVGAAVKSVVADLDNDGQQDDIVMSKAEGSSKVYVAWYRHNGNPQGGQSAWDRTILLDNVTNVHALEVADFDQDGHADIFAGSSFGSSGLRIFYGSNNGNNWTQQNLDNAGKQYVVAVSDLDQDGDLDFVGPNVWQGEVFAYYNQLIEDGGSSTSPPSAPTALQANALSESSIRLQWSDNANNEIRFLIQRSLAGASAFVQVAEVGANVTSFTDQNLDAATSYDYRVRAANNSGESAYSNTVSITTDAPMPPDVIAPSIPTNLQVINASFNQVSLSWSAATDNVAVVEYNIYQNGALVAQASSNSFTVANLAAETSYSFQISAVDAAGNESGLSAAITATTAAAPDISDSVIGYWPLDESNGQNVTDVSGNYPGALVGNPQWQPTSGQVAGALQFTGGSDGVELGAIDIDSGNGLTLSVWVNPSSFAGDADEARFISKASSVSGPNHFWMLGNYLDGSAIRFRLKTSNGGTAELITAKGLLDLNTWSHVAATYDGNQMKVFLNGEQVASQNKTGNISVNANVNVALGNQPSGAGGRGLVGLLDEAYIFDVALTADEIASVMSDGSPPDDTPSVPTAPSALVANAASESSIVISWSDNSDNEGGFSVERSDGTSGFVSITSTTANVSSYTDSGLNASTSYSYRVRAFNQAGSSSYSNIASAITDSTPEDTEAPSVPSNLQATAVMSDQLDLSWNMASDNVAVTAYRIYQNGISIASSTSTSFTASGLSPSTEYSYRVSALDAAGNESNLSQAIMVTTPAAQDSESPSMPDGLTATAVTDDQVSLSWQPTTDNIAVNAYRVYQDGTQVAEIAATRYVVAGLSAATSYQFQVSAVDAAGNESAPSSIITVTTESTAPPPQQSELVAHWRFDQSSGLIAGEETGVYPGMLSGNPVWQPALGQLSGALAFSGTDSVQLGNIDTITGNALTLAVWVNPSSFSGKSDEARFISKATGIKGTQHYWMLGNYLDGTAARFRLKTSNGGTKELVSPTGLLPLNTWSHVVATYDGAAMKLYINGNEVASTTKTGSIAQNNSIGTAIGNQPTGAGDRGFQGRLDDLYIFNAALTPVQIQALMTGVIQ